MVVIALERCAATKRFYHQQRGYSPMDRSAYTNADYDRPHVPPGTPPVIDSAADAGDAATLVDSDGDSDSPGSRTAHLDRELEDASLFDGGDTDEPGHQPDEIVPDKGDTVEPGQRPDEVSPDQGDFDRPGGTPDEMPPQPDTAPAETPPPD
jgi:hypothetical protein